MLLYLVRHGQSLNQTSHHLWWHYDWPLTQLGKQQAWELSHRLQNTHFHHIYTSDLQRAHQTAQIIAQSHNHIPLSVEPLLRERSFGPYDGMHKDQLSERYQIDKQDIYLHLSRLTSSESTHQFYHRTQRVLSYIHDQHHWESILCVAHGGIKMAAELIFADQPHEQIDISPTYYQNTSLSIYDLHDSPVPIRFNCTAHLDEILSTDSHYDHDISPTHTQIW